MCQFMERLGLLLPSRGGSTWSMCQLMERLGLLLPNRGLAHVSTRNVRLRLSPRALPTVELVVL